MVIQSAISVVQSIKYTEILYLPAPKKKCSHCHKIKPYYDFTKDISHNRCKKCFNRKYNNKKYKTKLKGLTGHWTKWGGSMSEVSVNQHGRVIPQKEWACQSCGKAQPPQLTPYRYEYPPNEYLRVCSVCFSDKCTELFKRLALG